MANLAQEFNTIPGADALGFGFDVVGRYDTTSVTRAVFGHKTERLKEWTFPPTGITYWVPDNTSVFATTATSGSASVYESQQSFQSAVAVSAGASGSYAGFVGEFDFAYSSARESTASYYYGVYEASYQGWQLSLSDHAAEWLNSGFVAEIDKLPGDFSPATRDEFFRFYRRWGTHYVSNVSLGGSLSYFSAIQKAYSSNETQVTANVKLEYKAVFVSGDVQSKAEWNELGKTWAESRQVKVHATGGDTSVLDALEPGYGDSKAGVATKWREAVMRNPGIIAIQLSPLSAVAPAEKQEVLELALDAYLNGALLAWGSCERRDGQGPNGSNYVTSGSVIASGIPVLPNPVVTPPNPPDDWSAVAGFRVAILDASTLEPIMAHDYFEPWDVEHEAEIYDAIMKDVSAVSATGYFAVVAGFAIARRNLPTAACATWLRSVGAELKAWTGDKYTMSGGHCSYVCIGKQGLLPGRAVESFAHDGLQWPSPESYDANAAGLLLLYARTGVRTTGERALAALTEPGDVE
jgi:hypothetical protein